MAIDWISKIKKYEEEEERKKEEQHKAKIEKLNTLQFYTHIPCYIQLMPA